MIQAYLINQIQHLLKFSPCLKKKTLYKNSNTPCPHPSMGWLQLFTFLHFCFFFSPKREVQRCLCRLKEGTCSSALVVFQGCVCSCLDEIIPHICHFFTRAKFLENKIYTKKTRKLRQNTQ